jgi:hypothetical protein
MTDIMLRTVTVTAYQMNGSSRKSKPQSSRKGYATQEEISHGGGNATCHADLPSDP